MTSSDSKTMSKELVYIINIIPFRLYNSYYLDILYKDIESIFINIQQITSKKIVLQHYLWFLK